MAPYRPTHPLPTPNYALEANFIASPAITSTVAGNKRLSGRKLKSKFSNTEDQQEWKDQELGWIGAIKLALGLYEVDKTK